MLKPRYSSVKLLTIPAAPRIAKQARTIRLKKKPVNLEVESRKKAVTSCTRCVCSETSCLSTSVKRSRARWKGSLSEQHLGCFGSRTVPACNVC